jgi:hypothetical protein
MGVSVAPLVPTGGATKAGNPQYRGIKLLVDLKEAESAGTKEVKTLEGQAAALKTGDRLRIRVEVDQPSHVYIMNFPNYGGEFNALYPDPRMPVKNPLNGSFLFPPTDMGQTFEVTGPACEEYIITVCSLRDISAELQGLREVLVDKKGIGYDNIQSLMKEFMAITFTLPELPEFAERPIQEYVSYEGRTFATQAIQKRSSGQDIIWTIDVYNHIGDGVARSGDFVPRKRGLGVGGHGVRGEVAPAEMSIGVGGHGIRAQDSAEDPEAALGEEEADEESIGTGGHGIHN